MRAGLFALARRKVTTGQLWPLADGIGDRGAGEGHECFIFGEPISQTDTDYEVTRTLAISPQPRVLLPSVARGITAVG